MKELIQYTFLSHKNIHSISHIRYSQKISVNDINFLRYSLSSIQVTLMGNEGTDNKVCLRHRLLNYIHVLD